MREAVLVRFRTHIGHGVDRKRDVESCLIRLSGSSFDACSGCHARDNNLRYSVGLQLRLKIRTRKCTPCPLRHHDIASLAIELRNQIAEALGERRDTARLLRPTWCASSDIDQNDREIPLTKGVKQSAVSLNDVSGRMDKG